MLGTNEYKIQMVGVSILIRSVSTGVRKRKWRKRNEVMAILNIKRAELVMYVIDGIRTLKLDKSLS